MYYKSSDPALLAALKTHTTDADLLVEKANALGALLGGNAVYRNGIHGVSIAEGLVFPGLHKNRTSRLWTKPDAKNHQMQRPRPFVANGTPEEKAELDKIKAIWEENFPRYEVSYEPVLNAMGLTRHDLFGKKFGQFEHDGVVYVTTGAKVGPAMTEILGSEYLAATDDKESDEEHKSELAYESAAS